MAANPELSELNLPPPVMVPDSRLEQGKKLSSGVFDRLGFPEIQLTSFLSAGAIHTPHVSDLLHSALPQLMVVCRS